MATEFIDKRVVKAHEEMWEDIGRLRSLPYPLSAVMLLFEIASPNEVEQAKQRGRVAISLEDDGFVQAFSPSRTRPAQVYVDADLWQMYGRLRAFIGRLLYLYASEKESVAEWPQDSMVREHLENTFTENEVQGFRLQGLGGAKRCLDEWESRILDRIKHRLLNASPIETEVGQRGN